MFVPAYSVTFPRRRVVAGEAIDTINAMRRAEIKSPNTIRAWAETHGIGYKKAGRWIISRVALEMVIAGDVDALSLYLAGDCGELVARYFAACGVTLSVGQK